VLIVSFIATPGGAHNLWRHFVMDASVSDGLELHVLAPREYRDVDPAPFADGRVRFHALTELAEPALPARLLQRLVGSAALGAARWRTERWRARLDAIAPDVVLFNLAGMGDMNWCVPAGEACAARGTPYWLVLQHAHEEYHFSDDTRTDAALMLARGARRVLTVSLRNRRALESALGATLANAEPAVNGVTGATLAAGERVMRAHPVRTTGPARLLSLARFDPAFKGQDLLLEALSSAEWRAREWVLTLQGGGTHARLLERLARRHGFDTSRVVLRPHDGDIGAAFAAADLLVFPSRSEGTPFALVEGLAHGRPAVVTPVGGNDELVLEGRTGWVASAVSAEAFRAALVRAWTARATWPEVGQAGREHVVAGWGLAEPHRRLLASIRNDAGR
jgi:glycosyltransferase involved in cell wall biosynthesis